MTDPTIRRVILESPFKGRGATPEDKASDALGNLNHARRAMRDCALRGDSAIASHLLWTQPGILDDSIPEERDLVIRLGLAWGAEAAATVVYVDRGISSGMVYGIARAVKEGRSLEVRSLVPTNCHARGWLAGPWETEPFDLAAFDYLGMTLVMDRNSSGAWCGGIRIPKGDVRCKLLHDESLEMHDDIVHSYGTKTHDGAGFDCSHYQDATPRDGFDKHHTHYWTAGEVMARLVRMANQIDIMPTLMRL